VIPSRGAALGCLHPTHTATALPCIRAVTILCSQITCYSQLPSKRRSARHAMHNVTRRLLHEGNLTMKKLDACRMLGISLRTLERRMSAGEIKFTRSGDGQYAVVDFDPKTLQAMPPTRTEAPPAQSAAPPEVALTLQPAIEPLSEPDYLRDLDNWSTEALNAACVEWRKPADPLQGVATNQPAVSSSTMPSPMNYKRLLRAGSILMKRGLVGARPTYIRPPYHVDQACQDHNSRVSSVGAPEQWEHLWKGKTL
jgi:hypothetical protein